MSAVGSSVRTAQQIGGELVKATAAAAAGSLEAAQRAWRGDVKPREGSRSSLPQKSRGPTDPGLRPDGPVRPPRVRLDPVILVLADPLRSTAASRR